MMNNRDDKFVISRLRGEDNTTIVTTRLPDRIVIKLDDICAKTGRNRTQVIIMALEFALSRLEIEEL